MSNDSLSEMSAIRMSQISSVSLSQMCSVCKSQMSTVSLSQMFKDSFHRCLQLVCHKCLVCHRFIKISFQRYLNLACHRCLRQGDQIGQNFTLWGKNQWPKKWPNFGQFFYKATFYFLTLNKQFESMVCCYYFKGSQVV